MLASPVALWSKIPGMVVGTLILLLVNLVRLVSLFFIGVYFPKAFEVIHENVWQAAQIPAHERHKMRRSTRAQAVAWNRKI